MRWQDIGIRIDDEPLTARVHGRPTIAQVFHQPHEDFARHLVERRTFATVDRHTQFRGAVVGRHEPLGLDRGNESEQIPGLGNAPFADEDRQLLDDLATLHADIVEAFIDTWLRRRAGCVGSIIGKLFGDFFRFRRKKVFRGTILRQNRGRAERRTHCGADN